MGKLLLLRAYGIWYILSFIPLKIFRKNEFWSFILDISIETFGKERKKEMSLNSKHRTKKTDGFPRTSGPHPLLSLDGCIKKSLFHWWISRTPFTNDAVNFKLCFYKFFIRYFIRN